MKYLGQSDYQHATAPRIGVLLTNLGTPEAPTQGAEALFEAILVGSPGRGGPAADLVADTEWHHPQYATQALCRGLPYGVE